MAHPDFEEARKGFDEALSSRNAAAALAVLRPAARIFAAEEGARFRDLIARVPDEAWHDDVDIASAMGASFRSAGSPPGSASIGYFRAAEAALAGADPTGTNRGRDPERVALFLGRAAALRSLGRLSAALSYVEKAFALDRASVALPVAVRVELGARGSLERGMLELHMGNIAQAAEMLGHAHGLAEHNLIRAEQVECLGGLALVEYVNADLNRASEYVEAARALAEGTTLWTSNYAAPAVVAESLVAIDRHDLGTATRVEPEMLEAARSGDFEPFAFTVAGYRRLAERRLPEGLDFLQRARRGFRTWAPPGLGSSTEEMIRANILVLLDQGDEAWEILREIAAYPDHVICPNQVVAQLRFRHGDLQGAADALAECEKLGEDHSPRTLIELRLTRAAIEFERDEFTTSDAMMDRALATMARTGARAPLRAIEPGTLAAMVRRALTRPQSADVEQLLTRIAEATQGLDRFVEPLSDRERLVLAEVQKGSTVGEIAAALYISPNTVKTHLRRLYKKLGVTTRADAMRKASSLGLGS